MNRWEWEGMGLKKTFPLISSGKRRVGEGCDRWICRRGGFCRKRFYRGGFVADPLKRGPKDSSNSCAARVSVEVLYLPPLEPVRAPRHFVKSDSIRWTLL